MIRNTINSLILHERIQTTKRKAQEVKRIVEKIITRAAINNLHNWRLISSYLQDKGTVDKLMNVIGPRFASRPGGYTRILTMTNRRGDNAEMVLFELVERSSPKKGANEKEGRQSRRAAPSKAKTTRQSAPSLTSSKREKS